MLRERGAAVPSERQQGINLIWLNPKWKPQPSLVEAERIVSHWQFMKRLLASGRLKR